MRLLKGILFTTLLLTCLNLASAQNNKSEPRKKPENFVYPSSPATLSTSRGIEFKDDSKVEEVAITIDKETNDFTLEIKSRVTRGSVTIEIYQPDGDILGHFSVATQISSKSEIVNGNYVKTLLSPQEGDWKIKIIPNKASGEIAIESSMHVNKRQ
ncbi:hypothetical protein [Fulvivirga ligni]|uniref:hypothetical protein n=1 Tax=Fulvivirga ligni TaxID=2904246 RepID=UPI001F46D1A9|nr:hypothetical protein [Fulvivirga ligni]UII22314.1 hypothetical protein LVD16_03605 [Fulvivirga ligni]